VFHLPAGTPIDAVGVELPVGMAVNHQHLPVSHEQRHRESFHASAHELKSRLLVTERVLPGRGGYPDQAAVRRAPSRLTPPRSGLALQNFPT
jgi:hypothetical protein